jgi:hypothetical protein
MGPTQSSFRKLLLTVSWGQLEGQQGGSISPAVSPVHSKLTVSQLELCEMLLG